MGLSRYVTLLLLRYSPLIVHWFSIPGWTCAVVWAIKYSTWTICLFCFSLNRFRIPLKHEHSVHQLRAFTDIGISPPYPSIFCNDFINSVMRFLCLSCVVLGLMGLPGFPRDRELSPSRGWLPIVEAPGCFLGTQPPLSC